MSIREYGIQQPINVVRRSGAFPFMGEVGEGAASKAEMKFMIVMGERRYRASLLAGKETIPAIIEDLTDEKVAELALLENFQRQDMNVIEEAKAFQDLLNRGWSKETLAGKLGIKQVWRVDERISLLSLTLDNQALVVSGMLTNSQAFEMSRLSPDRQSVVLRKIMAGELETYNKLRAYVDGLLALDQQENIFALQTLSDEERQSITNFENMVKGIERLITAVSGTGNTRHLQKVAFHTDVTPERLDYIIQSLMRIRKTVMSGAGIKEAIAA
jgi:ParB family chromosome partitioning protein